MADLVQIPWQPLYWLTPHTLNLLVAASRRLGYNGTTTGLMLYTGDKRGLLSAWRSYAMQLMLWLAYLAGGNVASNPDSGARMHMRGGAFDLVRTDLAAQAACRAVGLIQDPVEDWHWNDPLGTSMPIIKTNTALASDGITPLIEGGSAMSATMPVKYTDTATGKDTWARRNGLRIEKTTDLALAKRWKLEIGLDHLSSITSGASKYLTQWAAAIAAEKADLAALFSGAVLDATAEEIAALVRAGIDIPTVAEIADAVADEQAQRLGD